MAGYGDVWVELSWVGAAVRDGMRQGRAVMPVADWRRATEDRPVNRVPVHMRDKIAATAERVATPSRSAPRS